MTNHVMFSRETVSSHHAASFMFCCECPRRTSQIQPQKFGDKPVHLPYLYSKNFYSFLSC